MGIEFIIQYLELLYYENLFCTYFSDEDIHHLLCGYDEHYENLLFNIYEPVLAASLGCFLADAPANSLEITPKIQSILYHRFAGKAHTEIEQILGNALAKLAEILSLSDRLTSYAKQSLHQLATAIENATKTESLERIFICPQYLENNPKFMISYGYKMDDELYRKVLAEFTSSQSMFDKISIMKSQIHSLANLEDLLLDAELSVDEMVIILKNLSPAEIVALMKKFSSALEMSFTDLQDCEKTLCDGLRCFVSSLPLEQQVLLEKAVKALETDSMSREI